MKQRISSRDTEHYQSLKYIYVFAGILIIAAIVINLFKNRFDLVIAFSGLLFFLLIGSIITRYYLIRFLALTFIDDSFLYISTISDSEVKIPLNKIKVVKYSSYPPSLRAEKFIIIKYFNEEMVLKKVIIMPTHLDTDDHFKWNRNILGFIKKKIENYSEII